MVQNTDFLESKEERIRYFRTKNLMERAREMLFLMVGAKKNMAIYPPHHSICMDSIFSFMKGAKSYFELAGEFPLRVVGEELYFEEKLLARESVLYYSLVKDCKDRKVGGINLYRGLNPEEFADFLYLFNLDPAELERRGGLKSLLEQRGITHIKIDDPSAYEEIPREEKQRVSHREEYFNAIEVIKDLADEVTAGKRLKISKANRVVGSLLNRVVENRSAVLGLAAIKSYDEYTSYHSVNVLILSLALGSMLPLDRSALMILGTGALLHDIGKVTIPQSIIKKRGPLTSAEWEIICQHPVVGTDILIHQPGVHPLSAIIAYEHHARYDLKGYPRIEEKPCISLFSRIVEITDVYDAMTSDRPYQSARDPQQAIRILVKNSGAAFDPFLVKVFIDMIGFFPVGTLVRIATGETAVVYEQSEGDPLHPQVKIIRDATGKEVEPKIVDLALLKEKVQEAGRAVIESVDPKKMGIDASEYL
jgi:HD-GYP domain-containing protein (c-di-GMP phosphodiesterase class II)